MYHHINLVYTGLAIILALFLAYMFWWNKRTK